MRELFFLLLFRVSIFERPSSSIAKNLDMSLSDLSDNWGESITTICYPSTFKFRKLLSFLNVRWWLLLTKVLFFFYFFVVLFLFFLVVVFAWIGLRSLFFWGLLLSRKIAKSWVDGLIWSMLAFKTILFVFTFFFVRSLCLTTGAFWPFWQQWHLWGWVITEI